MKLSGRGIGTKIFSGFIALIVIALIIGSAGYISLDRVINAGELNEASMQVQAKIFEARICEKNYILKKDPESYQKLTLSLDQLAGLTTALKSKMEQSKDADEIAEAQQIYKRAAAELKRLEEEDAIALKELQDVAATITTIAEEESSKAAAGIKENLLQSNAKTLKEYAFDRVKDVVSVGYDVMKFYYEQSMPKEAALQALRNLHFEGDNYFFVVQEDLILVAHGSNRALEGQDFGKIQDKKTGKTFMRELVDSALKNGGSYTEYFWTKPGMGDAVFPKVTYARTFKPWGLVVCAGVYIEDVEKQVAKTATLIEEGLTKLHQADAINLFSQQARQNAVYYFAFGQNAEKVGEYITKLKEIPIATEALKKDADSYLDKFTRRVKNGEARQKDITQIDEIAGKAEKIVAAVGSGAMASFGRTASAGKLAIGGFILVGIVAGLALATLLVRAIVKPIKRAIVGLDDASEQVAAASGQVSSASQQLAEGSSQQAASLEETSSALEEITSMTKQNADNATQANRLMKDSSTIVQRANQTMADLTASMTEISKASEETQKIIKTIDEIAFQTNLLALNAAVEAARAGEAGAGFAVVADEVRNLAMRAAEAAKNTAALIEGTVKKVKEGNQLVERTNDDFHEVSVSVTKSGELVGEIAAASQEQAQGIGQVNTSVAEMDKVVQQNAANAEESAAASEEMNAQAEQMKEYVGDLVKLVGATDGSEKGARNAKGQKTLRLLSGQGHPATEMKPQPGVPAPAPQGSLRRGKKGGGNITQVHPEQAIPFDGEMKDF
jgi:methyl-accepting chemotaxis protein